MSLKPLLRWQKALCPLLFILFHHASNAPCEVQHSIPTVRIGAILPLSGPMSFAGAEVRDAILLAVSEVNNAQHRYEVVFEDNGQGAASTITAAHKLLDIQRVNTLITLWPEAANMVAPLTDKMGILHYTIAWDPQIACSHRLTLSHQAMVNDYAQATLSLLKQKGIRKVAFFHDSVFQQGADILKEISGSYGIEVHRTHTFDRGKLDFRTEIAGLRKSSADGVLIWSIMPETEVFLKQLREMKVDLFTTGFFDVVQDISLIEGMPFPSEVYSEDFFQKKFEQKYGHSSNMKGPNAYDIIKVLAYVMEQSSTVPDAKELKERLLKVTNYLGAVGKFSIDSCGNSSYPIVVKKVKGGEMKMGLN